MKRSLRDCGQLLEKLTYEGHRPAVKAELEKLVGELDTVMLVNVKDPFGQKPGVYVGQVFGNKFHGQGMFLYDDGEVIAGDFYEGQYHGKAVVYENGGRICDQTFDRNDRTAFKYR